MVGLLTQPSYCLVSLVYVSFTKGGTDPADLLSRLVSLVYVSFKKSGRPTDPAELLSCLVSLVYVRFTKGGTDPADLLSCLSGLRQFH